MFTSGEGLGVYQREEDELAEDLAVIVLDAFNGLAAIPAAHLVSTPLGHIVFC